MIVKVPSEQIYLQNFSTAYLKHDDVIKFITYYMYYLLQECVF